mgnify:CR=1 FL=1
MSNSIFAYGKGFEDLHEKFRNTFIKPKVKLVGNLVAPAFTKNYSLIGTAFDYLLRFNMEHMYPDKIIKDLEWGAKSSYDGVIKTIEKTNGSNISVGFLGDVAINKKELKKIITDKYESSEYHYKKYISDGLPTNDLMQSVLTLARLDTVSNGRFIDNFSLDESNEDIKDLFQLYGAINEQGLKANNRVCLNPYFGEGSAIIGGSAGDLIIDDTIIDIKTTIHLKLDLKYFYQVLGYYILSLIGGIYEDKEASPINNIGIYFSRHSVLWKINVNEIADSKTFSEFKKYFINYAEERVWKPVKDDYNKSAKLDPEYAKLYPLAKLPMVSNWNYEPIS